MLRNPRQFLADARGSMAVLCATCLFILVAVAGAAIDYNRALAAEANLQSALDTAILAAAVTDQSAYSAAFQDAFDAALAMSGGELGAGDVTIGAPQIMADGTLKNTASGCLDTYFIKALGIACLGVDGESFAENGPSTAVALPSNPCVFFTEPNKYGFDVRNGGELTADCTVHVTSHGGNRNGNGLKVDNGGVANIGGLCMPRANVLNNGTLNPSSSTPGCNLITDPFAGLSNPPTNGCARQATTVNNGQTVTFSEGMNCGQVRVRNGGRLVLSPGIHTFDDPFIVEEGGVLEGEDVLVVLKKRTDYTVDGEIFLQGRRSGDYKGFVLFLEDHSGNSNRIHVGANANFRTDGVMYLPNTLFTLSSTVNEFATRSILVTDRIELNNGARFVATITQPSDTPFPAAFGDGQGFDEYAFDYSYGPARLSYDKTSAP